MGRWLRGAVRAECREISSRCRLHEIAATDGHAPAGRSSGITRQRRKAPGVSFATHIVDVEVDPETGSTKVVRYTVVQDAGKAIHPTYVEGQFQGGAVQGIGWALNEEYIYGEDGRLQNAGLPRLPHSGRLATCR